LGTNITFQVGFTGFNYAQTPCSKTRVPTCAMQFMKAMWENAEWQIQVNIKYHQSNLIIGMMCNKQYPNLVFGTNFLKDLVPKVQQTIIYN